MPYTVRWVVIRGQNIASITFYSQVVDISEVVSDVKEHRIEVRDSVDVGTESGLILKHSEEASEDQWINVYEDPVERVGGQRVLSIITLLVSQPPIGEQLRAEDSALGQIL